MVDIDVDKGHDDSVIVVVLVVVVVTAVAIHHNVLVDPHKIHFHSQSHSLSHLPILFHLPVLLDKRHHSSLLLLLLLLLRRRLYDPCYHHYPQLRSERQMSEWWEENCPI